MFSFFKAVTLLRELGETPTSSPDMGSAGTGLDVGGGMGGGLPGGLGGGAPMGGLGGGMGGLGGGMGGLGGGMGDPMGGANQEPFEVKTIPAADVWKLLEKIIQKDDGFFEEINIMNRKEKQQQTKKEKPKETGIYR